MEVLKLRMKFTHISLVLWVSDDYPSAMISRPDFTTLLNARLIKMESNNYEHSHNEWFQSSGARQARTHLEAVK